MKGKSGYCSGKGAREKEATRILPVGGAPHVSSHLGLYPTSCGMSAHTFRGRSHPPTFYSSEVINRLSNYSELLTLMSLIL